MRLPTWIDVAPNHDWRDAHPVLQTLFLFVAFFLRLLLPSIRIRITSIKRASGTHEANYDGKCWSLDFDVCFEGRWLPRSQMARAAVGQAKGLVELVYPYGLAEDGEWHHSFVWETPDGRHAGHVHLQIRRK
jgi:hypothetical protein